MVNPDLLRERYARMSAIQFASINPNDLAPEALPIYAEEVERRRVPSRQAELAAEVQENQLLELAETRVRQQVKKFRRRESWKGFGLWFLAGAVLAVCVRVSVAVFGQESPVSLGLLVGGFFVCGPPGLFVLCAVRPRRRAAAKEGELIAESMRSYDLRPGTQDSQSGTT